MLSWRGEFALARTPLAKGMLTMVHLFGALGRFAVRYRYPVVAGWAAITVWSVVAFPSLASLTTNTALTNFLPASAPSAQATQLASPFQNTRYAAATLVAVRTNGPLDSADQAAMDRIEARVGALPHVHAVQDVATSPDGAARQALIEADVPQDGSGEAPALVAAIRAQFGEVAAPAGLTFHLTGPLATTVDSIAALQSSQNATERLTYLLIIVLLLLGFRALLAPLLTLLPAALVLALSSPVIAAAVTRLGVRASVTTQFVLIVLVLGAGADYGLFLTFRVREELRGGRDPHDAVVRAVQTVGEPIAFSALTVIAALCALALAQLGFYQSLGPALAIGIALMLLAGLTLLPALLAIFGRAAFWPSSTSARPAASAGLWPRLVSGLLARPVLTLSLGVTLFAGLAFGLLGAPLSPPLQPSSGPAGSDATAGAAALAAHYPGSSQNPTLVLMGFAQPVWQDPAPLAAAEQGLAEIGGIQTLTGPLSPNGVPLSAAQYAGLYAQLGPAQALPPAEPSGVSAPAALYNLYRSTAQYVSADGLTAQFVAILADHSPAGGAQAAVPGLRADVARVAAAAGATRAGLYSQDAISYDFGQLSHQDLVHIIPLVVGLIGVLLALVLRSLVAPLYLVASVVLSYLATLGVVALIFVHLRGESGVTFILPFALFVFLMALGSDYNILVMTRIREEARTKPTRVAVRDAIARTGSTITTAGIILAGTFAVLAVTASGSDNQQFGFGIAAGILLDTFLVRTLLIPAVVVLLGRWNWWPAPLFRSGVPATPLAECVH
jgi:RND superfamily putative drug exporter